MNNKGMIGKCLMLIGVLMIAAGSIMLTMDKDKYFKDDKKEVANVDTAEPDVPDKPDDPGSLSDPSLVSTRCSGVFEKDGSILRLYPKDSKVSISLDSNISSISSDELVNDDLIVLNIDGELSIKCEEDKAVVTYGENEITGDYKKIGEYPKEEYFRDNYGDPTYLDGEYNLQFANDSTVINMFRKDSQIIHVDIEYSSGDNSVGYVSDFAIQSDGSMVSEMFDEKVILILSDEKLTIQVNSPDSNSANLVLNGEYNKTKTLSIDDIINDIKV